MPAEAPLAFGPTSGHLGDVWDLIWLDLPPLNWGHSSTFLWSFPRNALWAAQTSRSTLWPPPLGGGGTHSQHMQWPFGVGPCLPAKFHPSQPRDHDCRSPSFPWISRRTPGWGLGPDLTWAAPTKLGAFFNFCFIKISQKCTIWATRTSRSTLWPPPPRGRGAAGLNILVDLSGVDVVLHVHLQPWGSNGVAAYTGHTHTDSHKRWREKEKEQKRT